MKLNRDLLLMITENFQDDRVSLYSCLLVNRSWCEATVPLLWKIPGQTYLTDKATNILFNVILSHLSEDTRGTLKEQGIDLFTEIYQAPSFNYIYFWRHLDLQLLERMIPKNINEPNISIMKDELLKLFVNEGTQFTSLFFSYNFNCQINCISWDKQCFSDLKFFYCCSNIDQSILNELATVSKSIKIFNCDTAFNDDISGITGLIEVQKNLNYIRIGSQTDEQQKVIEELLIKKANIVQNLYLTWVPIDENFFLHFVNLKSLELRANFRTEYSEKANFVHSDKISLPALKILKANFTLPIMMLKLIVGASVQLTVISISSDYIFSNTDDVNNLIQIISQNCPNLEYADLPIKDYNLTEFEKLLNNCQLLTGLVIRSERQLQYKSLFEILNRSSPSSLFKFYFQLNRKFGPKYKLLRSFFAGWKDRHIMLLQIQLVNYCIGKDFSTNQHNQEAKRLDELIEFYETKGVVKKEGWAGDLFDDSYWIRRRCFS
jgi:hypothetical protein